MKYIKWKLKGHGKSRLTQTFPPPCTWQWRHCLGRTSTPIPQLPPQALPGPVGQDRAGPGCVTHHTGPRATAARAPVHRTALMESQHSPGQGKRCKYKVPPWTGPIRAILLLYFITTLHLGKKTYLHCCFLFCLLTHFFKYFYQTLFRYLESETKGG